VRADRQRYRRSLLVAIVLVVPFVPRLCVHGHILT
jgi:hypothetical protein